MEMGLRGKVALVTGGSEGIGRATALRLLQEGAAVAICARREDVLESTAARLREETGNAVLPVVADVSLPAACEAFVHAARDHFGRIHILVNNAGRSAAGYFEKVGDAEWQADVDLKLMAAVRCSRAAAPVMREGGYGRIVNVTHIGGKQPGLHSLPTTVTRAAGIALTKAMSQDLAEFGITVNTVCVGSIKSAQWVRARERVAPELTLEQFYERSGASIPMRRVGEAEEVADLVAFLASERAAYITGAAINIDGGASAVV